MTNYTFITESYNENGRVQYFAIDRDRIETLRVSETYDRFGHPVGTYNAGDYLELLSEKAVEIANNVAKEQDEDYNFEAGDIISGYDHSDVFNLIEDAFLIEGAFENLKDGEDYELTYETCRGFNYWDGSNHRTVIVEAEHDYTKYEIVDSEMSEKLQKAIDEMEFVKDVPGAKVYRAGDFEIVESLWANDFADYIIEE